MSCLCTYSIGKRRQEERLWAVYTGYAVGGFVGLRGWLLRNKASRGSKILESWSPEVGVDLRGHPVQSLKPCAASTWFFLAFGRLTFFQGSLFHCWLAPSVKKSFFVCIFKLCFLVTALLFCSWGHTNHTGSLCSSMALQVFKVGTLSPCRL